MDHGRLLEPKIDYCSDCGVMHNGKLDALSHEFAHILLFQERKLALEPDDDLSLTLFLQPIFEIIQEQRKKVLNRICFDEVPELEEAMLEI